MSSDDLSSNLAVQPVVRARIVAWQAAAHAELLAGLPDAEPRTFLYDPLRVLPSRSGKGLRPLLVAAAAEAFGGAAHDALPLGVALELMHLAFLVHDDIQDGSRERRGGPALHHLVGLPLALNVGDAYAAMATSRFARALRDVDAHCAGALADRWDRAMRETVEGQALDLGWQRDGVDDITVDQYIAMAGKKTAWYSTVLPLSMGAIVGSGRVDVADSLVPFGWFLGVMFQVANDLSGLQASPGEGDIEEGKITIVVVQLLRALRGAERDEFLRLMRAPRGERGPGEVAWVLDLMRAHGVIEEVRESLCGLAAGALAEAERALSSRPAGPGRDVLLAMTAHLLEESGQLAMFGELSAS